MNELEKSLQDNLLHKSNVLKIKIRINKHYSELLIKYKYH